MKNFLSFLSIVLLLAIVFPGQLTAQTYKQRARSAELLNQILPPELKITADNVRRASQKDIRDYITSASYSPDYAAVLEDILIPVKVIDWRALIVELTAGCGDRISYVMINHTGETYVYLQFTADRKCEKLYLRMVEAGLVYPFHSDFLEEDYSVCLTKKCFANYSGNCCWNVIYGVPKGNECPAPSCEPGSCKDCKRDIKGDYPTDVFMEN